jgi:tetratricopeptide (TPR) repeat protein
MADDTRYVYAYGARGARRILLGMFQVENLGEQGLRYSPIWPRIWKIGVGCLTLAYLTLVSLFYFRERYMRGMEGTSWGNSFLYFVSGDAKERHLTMKGDTYIGLAKDALKREDYGEFARYIGVGASLSRANLEGQRLCADLYFAFGRTEDAYRVLEESLVHAKQDRDHFRNYLRRCFTFDQDQMIIRVAEAYMNDPEVDPGIQADLRVAYAQANFLRGNFDLAADFVRKSRLDLTLEGYTLLCQISWERGDRQVAVTRLTDAARTFPNADHLRALLARWHKELGNNEQSRDALNLLAVRDPSAHSPRVQVLYLLTGDENAARRKEQVDRLMADFALSEAALLELGQFANDTADTALSERLLKHATDNRFPSRPKFLLTHVECLTNAGRNKEAIAIVDELFQRDAKAQWFGEMRVTFEALRTIAYYADNQPDIGAINLKKVMDTRNVPPQLLVAIGRKLIQTGRFAEANNTLVAAHLRHENNQALLLQLVRMKIENEEMSDDLEVYLRRLMATRRPPSEVLEKAYARIASDRFLFSEGRSSLLRDITEALKVSTRSDPGA